MPAVTVPDLLVLPRISRPDVATALERPVRSLTTAPRGVEGEGFPVRRAFAGVDVSELDPFVHMDEMGSVNYGPGEPKGTPLASASRLRDRHVHHRRHLPPSGLTRWRRSDHER